MKVLALFREMRRPDEDGLRELETNDKCPRVTIFSTTLNADILDRRRLERVPAFRRAVYRFLPLEFAAVIEAFLIRKHYDVVLSWGEKLGFPFALLCRLVGEQSVPHVAMCSWPSKGFKALMLRLVHSHIDRLILWSTVQHAIVVDRIKVPPMKIAFINYYVDQKFFRPMGRGSDMICSVGSEMRDFPTLLNALNGIDIKCHIATGAFNNVSTSWVNTLERMDALPPNVTIGKKSPSDLRKLYARSRFVVIPLLESDTDNGITCILEAMAMGKPVICSRIKGQVDVIQDGKTGIFVPVGDSKALRNAIQYLWNNPEVAKRMGQAGREYVEEFQTLDKFVSDVHTVVKNTIAIRNPENVLSTLKNGNGVTLSSATTHDVEENLWSREIVRVTAMKHIPVLMYHRVCNDGDANQNEYVVEIDMFERQLRYFAEHNYYTPRIADVLDHRNNTAHTGGKPLLITFDDGYVDTLENVVPLLRQYGFSATVFIIADFSRRTNWWDVPKKIAEARLMEKYQVLDMRASGIEIGSHGFSHRSMPILNNDDLAEELFRSKRVVEELLAQPVQYLAYPYGEVDQRVKVVACQAGYRCAFATNSGPMFFHNDLYQIRRTLITNRDDELYLHLKLAGFDKALRWSWSRAKTIIGKRPQYNT